MPRVTHVKKAQQRYEQVPVIDPETGQQKTVPVMKNGQQKVTKRGVPVTMKLTREDRTKPKPNLKCDFPGCTIDGGEILPGTPYMWIAPKTSTYGSSRKNRHAQHRSWFPWEYSNSMSARLAQIAHDFWEEIDGCESEDDVQSALDTAAESIKEIAEEKREAAGNIEDGFGHATEKSEELESQADELESWADEVSGQTIPDVPDPEDRFFIEGPDGSRHGDDVGYESEEDARSALTGMIEDLVDDDSETTEDDYSIVEETPDEPSADELNDWRGELQDALSMIDEPPV